jgi:hypothetical protein
VGDDDVTQRPLQVFVESYHGTYEQAQSQFRVAAARHAAAGYQPTSQNWVEEGASLGCLTCALLVILFISIIGILLLPFILLRKRKGTLTVTYSLVGADPPVR